MAWHEACPALGMSTEPVSESPAVETPAPAGAITPTELPQARATSMLMMVAGAVACAGAAVTIGFVAARPAAREQGGHPTARTATAITSARAHTTAPPPARWSTARQARWVSNHPRSMAVEVEADNAVTAWMKQVRPTLVVRCLQKRIDVFVFTDSAARIETEDENHTVTLSLDAGVGSTERWPDSAEHDALFAPDGAAFARRLAQTGRLRFGFTPHNAQPVEASFDLEGAADAIAPVLARCGG